MKVLEETSALLTNLEVINVLQDRGVKNPLSTVQPSERKLHESLVGEGAEEIPDPLAPLPGFLEAVGHFQLTTAEVLQLVNLRPRAPVELYLVIESCDERLDDDAMDELIALVEEHLG